MMYQKNIVPIDHGNMKTEHKVFTSGFVQGDCRPALREYLHYAAAMTVCQRIAEFNKVTAMGKKNAFVTTIGFNKNDPAHVHVAEFLNRMMETVHRHLPHSDSISQQIGCLNDSGRL